MYFCFSKAVTEHRMYYIGRILARLLSYVVYRKMTVKGKENIPSDGPFIIASNHIAFSDPAVIIAHCPRTVHFMAKSELFENPLKAYFMRHMNAFPVKRNSSDRNALRRARKILEKGWVLGIFPEGRRDSKSSFSSTKNGVAYLAKITGADILPVCIYRDRKDRCCWHRLVLSYGKIIKNSELGFDSGGNRTDFSLGTKMIIDRIKELWEIENENYNS